jgi:hypothetical protein
MLEKIRTFENAPLQMILVASLTLKAISLKFRLLSIQFTFEAFDSMRKMSVMGMFRELRD